jgi:hypothetical protein
MDSAQPGALGRAPDSIRVDPDAWYSVSEVGRLLGVTRQTVLNRRCEGLDVPVMARGLGGRLYARGSEIDAFLQRRGERPAKGKLTEGQAAEVRRLLAKGLTQREVAQRFGVSPSTISSHARRTTNPPANRGAGARSTRTRFLGTHRSAGVER